MNWNRILWPEAIAGAVVRAIVLSGAVIGTIILVHALVK